MVVQVSLVGVTEGERNFSIPIMMSTNHTMVTNNLCDNGD